MSAEMVLQQLKDSVSFLQHKIRSEKDVKKRESLIEELNEAEEKIKNTVVLNG